MAPGSSEKKRAGVSIRSKIVAVTVFTLALSFAGHLYFGASLISSDKTSYLFEFTASETRAAAEGFEDQVAALLRATRVAAALGAGKNADSAAVSHAIRESLAGLRVDDFALLRARNSQDFEVLQDLTTAAAAAPVLGSLRELGWTPTAVREAGFLAAPAGPETLSLAGSLGADASVAFYCHLHLDLRAGGDAAGPYSLYLLDGQGKPLLSRMGEGFRATEDDWRRLAADLPRGVGERGAREWRIGDHELIVGYRRVTGGLLLVSAIPRDVAFRAVQSLILRSLLTGLGILLLTAGASMALARALTSRLLRLSAATASISAGDFSVQIPVEERARDEITVLSQAFNSMAKRISELIVAAAEKLRMQHELDTGRAYQGELIPKHPFTAGGIRIAGTYFPATECAGDWWRYFPLRGQVLLVIADATGHGVQAALSSSLLQGACLAWVQRHAQGVAAGSAPAALNDLLQMVNRCALASGGAGSTTATLMAILVDLNTGDATVANAAHPVAYLVDARPRPESDDRSVFDDALVIGNHHASSPIGQSAELRVAIVNTKIVEGSALLVYSDGLFDARSSDGQRLRKSAVLQAAVAGMARGSRDAVSANETLSQLVHPFFESPEGATNLDDVTLVVITRAAAAGA